MKLDDIILDVDSEFFHDVVNDGTGRDCCYAFRGEHHSDRRSYNSSLYTKGHGEGAELIAHRDYGGQVVSSIEIIVGSAEVELWEQGRGQAGTSIVKQLFRGDCLMIKQDQWHRVRQLTSYTMKLGCMLAASDCDNGTMSFAGMLTDGSHCKSCRTRPCVGNVDLDVTYDDDTTTPNVLIQGVPVCVVYMLVCVLEKYNMVAVYVCLYV